MAISSIGVGSGLPLDELLSDLRKSENTALNAISSRQNRAEHRLSAYGTLKSTLESLQTAAATLNKTDTYGALKASVTGDAYSANTTAKAIPGEYAIKVTQLATKQTLHTAGVEDRTAAFGTGGSISFTLKDGGTKILDLSDSGTSLNDIVKAINSDKSLGFTATLINDGTTNEFGPDTPHRLLLTATTSGSDGGISSITVDGNEDLASVLNFGTSIPSTVVANGGDNAELEINGIPIKSQTNIIEDVIEGVTLTLNKVSTEEDNLSVTPDNSLTQKAITQFVTAYNALQTTVRALTSYDIENQQSSALTGDSLARRLQTDVRNTLNVVAPDGDLQTLSQLGISTNIKTGMLEVDDAKLDAALKNNMSGIQDLLSGTNGVGNRLKAVSDTFNSKGGLFSVTADSIKKSIVDLQRQYTVTVDRIDAKMDNYRRQFTSLDSMVSQMNSVSNYLTQQLSMLENIGKQK